MRPVISFAALLLSFSPLHSQVVNSTDYSRGDTVGIPRGAIFTVLGERLGQSTEIGSPPLPTTLGGATLHALCGESVFLAPLLYSSPGQINAVLPSTVPEGRCILQVFHGDTMSFNYGFFTVLGGRFAPYTSAARGFGPAILQQYDSAGQPSFVSLNTAAKPGAIVSIWGSGLGPLASGPDADAPAPGQLRDDVRIYVDGLAVTPDYAGRAPGYPGADQINFRIPPSVRPRCFVRQSIFTGDRFTLGTTLAVSPAGGPCTNELGIPTSSFDAVANGQSLRVAMLNFRSATTESATPTQMAEAWIALYDAADLSYLANGDSAGLPDGAAVCAPNVGFDGTYGLPLAAFPFGPNPTTMPKVYGRFAQPNPPMPFITGDAGCQWTWQSSTGTFLNSSYIVAYAPTPTCTGSAYQFGPGGTAGGTLPQPRPIGDIASFVVSGSKDSFATTWSASTAPSDTVTLAASSYQIAGGIAFFLAYQEYACQLHSPGRDASFTFPQPATASVLTGRNLNPPTMSVTTVNYRIVPAKDPNVDLTILRTTNSAIRGGTPR